MIALRFLIGVFAERLRKTTDLVSITAQTPLDKQRARVQGPSGMVQDGAAHSASLPTPARLKLAYGDTGASLAQDTIVNHHC